MLQFDLQRKLAEQLLQQRELQNRLEAQDRKSVV